VSPPRSIENTVQAWLDTVDAGGNGITVRTQAVPTIVPSDRRGESVRRANDFLTELARRGQPVELRPGKTIGEGGMGLVREAEQVALGRMVAIKTVKPGRADPGAASDLLREAWITGALEHPNVVPVHHLEIDEGLKPLLILKRVDGVEWSKLFNDPAEVLRRFGASDLFAWNLGILHQVLNAVRFAHARRVIHRDLKPSNVMIGNFGEVYLLDWGIAASLDEDPTGRFPHISESSDIAGTPSYMAPEMLGREDQPPLSERTDVYLAGAVLFELITGQPPHLGNSAVAIISSVILSKPTLPGDTPPELAQICLRAMHPDPADRYQTVETLQQALQRYLEHRGSLRLASGAATQLAELIELAATNLPANREEIYRRVAICRFAFHEALAVWRENTEARTALTRAAIAVAEYELACGDPRAAVTLLSELHDKPALLATAQAAIEAQAKRQRELEALVKDVDSKVEPGTRRALIGLTGAFVVLPLLAGVRSDMGLRTHTATALFAFACLLTVWAMSLWVGRKPMTAINRRVFAAGRVIFVTQTLLAIGCWRMGFAVAQTQTLNLFAWGALTAMFAVHTDRWLALSSVGYLAAFLVASEFPDQRMFCVSAANLALALVLYWRWRPASLCLERA
jgi:serine/threonine-protein kinase